MQIAFGLAGPFSISTAGPPLPLQQDPRKPQRGRLSTLCHTLRAVFKASFSERVPDTHLEFDLVSTTVPTPIPTKVQELFGDALTNPHENSPITAPNQMAFFDLFFMPVRCRKRQRSGFCSKFFQSLRRLTVPFWNRVPPFDTGASSCSCAVFAKTLVRRPDSLNPPPLNFLDSPVNPRVLKSLLAQSGLHESLFPLKRPRGRSLYVPVRLHGLSTCIRFRVLPWARLFRRFPFPQKKKIFFKPADAT